MTPQEREVISGIFDRLKQGAGTPREPEAERFIADLISRQPYAPYVMAQSLYVQEQAMTNMQQQMERMQAELREAQAKAQGSGGFLSGLFGGGQQPAPRPAPQSSQGPWGGQAGQPQGGYPQAGPQQGYPQGGGPQGGPWGGQAPQRGGGSGFLGSALTTAAGVAGGMVAGNMLMNAFSGHGGGMFGGGHLASADSGGIWGDQGASVSNASDYDTGGLDTGSGSDPDVQNASYNDSGDYDTGGLDSGGDDSSWT